MVKITDNTPLEIIGVDHGFKNIKTAHSMFPAAISKLESLPDDPQGVIGFEGKYYSIHGKPVSSVEHHNKSGSKEFYLLTLAALAKELDYRGRKKARVILAAGLPYKWLDSQKETFQEFLFQNKEMEFSFEGKEYQIRLEGVSVYAQGICAILRNSRNYKNFVLVDLGGETIDIIPFKNGIPDRENSRINTEASIYCQTSIAEKIESTFYERIQEEEIIEIILAEKKETNDAYVLAVQEELKKYAEQVMTTLREFKINVARTQLVFCGGGSEIIKNFGVYDTDNVTFLSDMHANAKGFELAATIKLEKSR